MYSKEHLGKISLDLRFQIVTKLNAIENFINVCKFKQNIYIDKPALYHIISVIS